MRLIHSLLPVISAVAIAAMVSAQAEYDALEARALFIGTDSSDPMASGPAVFRDPHNLPSAVASMVWFLANKAMFCPREAEVFTDPLAYDNFLVALNQFRGFTQSRTREIKVQLSGNLNMFVEEILQQAQDEVLEGVATEMGPGRDVTMKETAVALRGLIPPFVEDRSWKHWALTTIVIKRTEKGREGDEDGEGQGSRVILETSKLVLRLSREPHSGVTGLEPQVARLTRAWYEVDEEFLRANAERLTRNVETINVDLFIEALSTKLWDRMLGRASVRVPNCQPILWPARLVSQGGRVYHGSQRWMSHY